MFDWINNLDHEIALAMNAAQTPFWDSVMLFFSGKLEWVPLYISLIVLMFLKNTYKPGNIVAPYKDDKKLFYHAAALGLIAAMLTFLCTEQVCNILKNTVQRLRPGHDPLLDGLLNLPEGKGGLYSFVSAHAANTFGLAMITSLIFRRRWYTIVMFLWAAIVGFSRIYLTKHFMSDVVCGALVGMLVAYLIYMAYVLRIRMIGKSSTSR